MSNDKKSPQIENKPKSLKEKWDAQSLGKKLVICVAGFLLLCVFLVILAFLWILSTYPPELAFYDNSTEIDGNLVDFIGNNTTYTIDGLTEDYATVTVDSSTLGIKQEKLNLSENNGFELTVQIPRNISKADITFFASKQGKQTANTTFILTR